MPESPEPERTLVCMCNNGCPFSAHNISNNTRFLKICFQFFASSSSSAVCVSEPRCEPTNEWEQMRCDILGVRSTINNNYYFSREKKRENFLHRISAVVACAHTQHRVRPHSHIPVCVKATLNYTNYIYLLLHSALHRHMVNSRQMHKGTAVATEKTKSIFRFTI